MKKSIFKTVSVLTVLACLMGCSKREAAKAPGTRTIVDHTGQEVTIPAEINRIVMGSILPLPSVYCMFTGSCEKLVGMHPSSLAAAQNSYLATVFPEIKNVDSSFVQNGAVNIEEVLKLKPDVVFYNANNPEERQIYESAGIPTVGFSVSLSDYNCVETYADWVDLLGKIFGDTGRADKIIKLGRQIEKNILAKTSQIAEEDKPRVLILFNYNDSGLIAGGDSWFSSYWIETAGGRNAAKEIKMQGKINMEQVYEWNPDMIFITNFSPRLAEDLLNNNIEGDDWSVVKAVKEGKVFKFPLGMYRWFPPASDTPLVLEWLAKTIQPEVFADLDMDKEITEYYKTYYGCNLNKDDLQAIYNPVRAAAYGK